MTATLIVSLSGLDDACVDDYAGFAAELDARGAPASWLLPPRPRDGRHHPDGPAIGWLRGRIDDGDALVVHGYDHKTNPIGSWERNSVTRLRRRAEFASLPTHEAALRLTGAIRALAGLGLSTDVFAAPKGMASAGTLVALGRLGFRICVEGTGVWLLGGARAGNGIRLGTEARTAHGVRAANRPRPGSGPLVPHGTPILVRGRLLSAGRSGPSEGTDLWRGRALVVAAARGARRGGLVRIGVRADDLRRPSARQAVLDAVDTALAAGAAPATYRAPQVGIGALSA